jgi:hypothetical protein
MPGLQLDLPVISAGRPACPDFVIETYYHADLVQI